MGDEFERVYDQLAAWCRARGYAGHDPFDALNSRLFQASPLRRSRAARLVWTQLLKRSPFNLRRLALVPEGRNPKGTALFALAALARYRTHRRGEDAAEARALLDDLLGARLDAGSPGGGAAWGYNFDWQGRAFYAPRGTPAIVPTAFAVRALVEAARVFGGAENVGAENGAARAKDSGTPAENGDTRAENNDGRAGDGSEYLSAARRACGFVLSDLNRGFETGEEVCFSYTPLDRTCVFNASLLAAEALATTGALTGERELLAHAARATRYVVRRQRADGSWAYGGESFQAWADNFHTAFILTSLARVGRSLSQSSDEGLAPATDDGLATVTDEGFAPLVAEIERASRRGYEFWAENFFLADGWPKYFPDRKYPADAHSAGACVVACAELKDFEPRALGLAGRVGSWAVRELFDARGFFRYQRRRFHTVRTPYMRWSQGWMLYALARLLEARAEAGRGG